ncbi:hypothetical protein ACJJTC_003372 [Scirpophaga incertulas]
MTNQDWHNMCQKVIKNENEYRRSDPAVDTLMEEFVINVDDDSDVSNDSSSFESEYEDSSDCDEAVPSTSAGFSNFYGRCCPRYQGADLEFLMAANDHELLTLVPGIINEGKLRIALDQLKESKNKDRNSVVGTKSNELFVATPQRTAIITSSLVTPPVWELQNTQENCSTLNTEPVSQAALVASPSILTWDPQISEWLKFSSFPRDLVDTKWKDCLRERLMVRGRKVAT